MPVIKALREAGLRPIIFVEPQEEEGYRAHWHDADIVVLDRNDAGIAYARNAMRAWARARGEVHYWQVDDNIHGFVRASIRKVVPCMADEALAYGEALAKKQARIALLGFVHRQYAWCTRKAWSYTSIPTSCVLTRTDTGIYYDEKMRHKEDLDFTVAHWAAGWGACVVNQFAMEKPKMGSMKGGLYDDYQARVDEEYARKLCLKWPRWFTLDTNALGHVDAKLTLPEDVWGVQRN